MNAMKGIKSIKFERKTEIIHGISKEMDKNLSGIRLSLLIEDEEPIIINEYENIELTVTVPKSGNIEYSTAAHSFWAKLRMDGLTSFIMSIRDILVAILTGDQKSIESSKRKAIKNH